MKQDKDVAIIRSDDERISVVDVLNGQHDTALKFATEYAALSSVVYAEEEHEAMEEFDVLNNWKPLDIDFDKYRPTKKGKWLKGLKVVSYYKVDNESTYVTITFRGTRFSKWRDWYANLDWATRYVPLIHNAYKQTILQINDYINAIEEHLLDNEIAKTKESIVFNSTGHSLGGGLAQQAAYASHRIKTVFAYDPSPVTGFWSIPKSKRHINSEGLQIYRIWEHGEVLLYLRHITKTAQKFSFKPNINPRVVEVRVNFVENADPIEEHSMIKLARELVRVQKRI